MRADNSLIDAIEFRGCATEMLTAGTPVGDRNSTLRDNPFQCCDASREIRLLDDQRRQDADGVFSRGEEQHALVPAAFDYLIRGLYHVETPDQTVAADSPDPSRASCNLAELFAEPRSVFPDRSEQPWFGESVDDIVRYRGNERSPAERRTVISWLDCGSDILRHEHGTHWKPARQRLRQSQHVWCDADALVGK